MSVAVAEEPCIRHTLPGRVRVHVPVSSGGRTSLTSSHIMHPLKPLGDALRGKSIVHCEKNDEQCVCERNKSRDKRGLFLSSKMTRPLARFSWRRLHKKHPTSLSWRLIASRRTNLLKRSSPSSLS